MAVVVTAIDLNGLKRYRDVNPVKFAWKYGEVDFNDLPPRFEGLISLYKGFVAKERGRREALGLSHEDPIITPWTFFPKAVPVVEAPVEAVAVEPVVEPVVQTPSIEEAPVETEPSLEAEVPVEVSPETAVDAVQA